jgi:hypothetical protein
MDYVKGILSGLAAIILAECVPGPWSAFRGISQERATGLAAIAGGLAESAFLPLFWILAALFFALFFAASRLSNKVLRVFLFWIPTLTVSVLCIAIVALITYLFVLSDILETEQFGCFCVAYGGRKCALQANKLCVWAGYMSQSGRFHRLRFIR